MKNTFWAFTFTWFNPLLLLYAKTIKNLNKAEKNIDQKNFFFKVAMATDWNKFKH